MVYPPQVFPNRMEADMVVEPTITVHPESTLQAILDADVWAYDGHTICEPCRDKIRLVDGAEGAPAWIVYEALVLDPNALRKIYANDDTAGQPGAAKRRAEEDAPQSAYLQGLKNRYCAWCDFASWIRLARLTGRRIAFHRDMPFPGCPATSPLATFHPDGRIEESPRFLRELNDTHSFPEYLMYKTDLPGIKIARR